MRPIAPRLNELILQQASKLTYQVSDSAPNTVSDLWRQKSGIMTVWAGESDNTIFADPAVNWAFRALHDQLHLDTGLGFDPSDEQTLGWLQAQGFDGQLADLVYCEVAAQAAHFERTGEFVKDQREFALTWINNR